MAAKILEYLRPGNYSKKELAQKLGRTKPHRHLDELMSRMLKKGLVKYTIPDKPNSRLQKYQITEKGKSALKKNDTRH